MINPNKHVRKSIIDALSPIKVYSNRVPKTANNPTQYILISSMGKNEYAICKNGNEWQVNLNLEFFYVGNLGFDYTSILDDMVEVAIPKMKLLRSDSVKIKNVFLESERDMSFDTATNSVNRRIITYNIWCDYGS